MDSSLILAVKVCDQTSALLRLRGLAPATIPVLDIDSTLACGDMAPVRKALGEDSRHPQYRTFA